METLHVSRCLQGILFFAKRHEITVHWFSVGALVNVCVLQMVTRWREVSDSAVLRLQSCCAGTEIQKDDFLVNWLISGHTPQVSTAKYNQVPFHSLAVGGLQTAAPLMRQISRLRFLRRNANFEVLNGAHHLSSSIVFRPWRFSTSLSFVPLKAAVIDGSRGKWVYFRPSSGGWDVDPPACSRSWEVHFRGNRGWNTCLTADLNICTMQFFIVLKVSKWWTWALAAWSFTTLNICDLWEILTNFFLSSKSCTLLLALLMYGLDY